MRSETIAKIERHKIIAIVRGLTDEQLLPAVEAMRRGGIRLVEVTFDQSGKMSAESTASQIAKIASEYKGEITVGAGTVMSENQAKTAFEAGAKYIISPNVSAEVIQKTRALEMVSIPGALTPSEIAAAHECGADFVKLFPAGELGLSYIKAVMAPLNHIRMLAVGGIDENNLKSFLSAGVCGVGVGSNIVKKSHITSGEFDKITALARKYTEQI